MTTWNKIISDCIVCITKEYCHLSQSVDISHKLHNVREILLQPGSGPGVDGPSNVQLRQGVVVQDKVLGELALGILKDDAGKVEKVDIWDGGLVP